MKRLFVLLCSCALLAGCGGSDPGPASSDGERVFRENGCGGCHVLAAAGSMGNAGPNLDEARPSQDDVATQVERGGNGMPAFAGRLSDAEIEAVARYVSQAASQTAAKLGQSRRNTAVQ